ncbi:ABC transporter permease [Fusibacter sp. 3D3]|uniref:cell division protein FtsX n=1 Tax=Fusibacter sp. 3D3 TaxID=1048380 RepID=UPI000853B8D6|nr:permease-like cell division protein FtsX [Fusibacter sp. 3D3]GAU77259.1 cell division protein FtsX [Fusibacter sp. 3D3]
MSRQIERLHYFIKEAITIFKTNKVSNLLSILSLTLIFFIFSVLASSREVGNTFASALSEQAEISVYYDENLSSDARLQLIDAIKVIEGVKSVQEISVTEAYERMKSVLGDDATVLNYLETNPFLAFLEIEIDLNRVESITAHIRTLENVDTVRDNIDILTGVRRFIHVVTFAFAFVSIAMGISTVVLTGHIIRQGIYNNREQITTMTLLGAPTAFMMIPYLIEGLWITLSSGLIAMVVNIQCIKILYSKMDSPLPFVPMPEMSKLISISSGLLILVALGLGIVGSLFGWYSVKEK